MSADISNLLGMAKTAELGGNMEEALGYYNRVLELDPTLADAWIGKGRAAGWQSTIAYFRLPEAIIAFNHAISNVSESQKDAVRKSVAQEVNSLVTTLYGMCRDHMEEFSSLPNSWPNYISQVRQMLDALDEAERWSPDDLTTLGNIIHLCKDNLEGHVSRDELNYGAETTHGLSPDYEQLLQRHLDNAVGRMKEIDPTYSAPLVEKKVGSDCFVVTATMDDNLHPHAVTLRQLRDLVLSRHILGIKFVRAYYKFGPRLAYYIRRHRILRALSYIMIVAPAALLSRVLLSR